MKDNFSAQAEIYAKYRPLYPPGLFEYINEFAPEKKLAWDCGTGNGQAAQVLSRYYEKVFATDISQKQINNAQKEPNIVYAIEPAEKTSLPSNSVDLITVSQALHWFSFDQFYKEVRRVGKPNALIAVWTYNLLKINPSIDLLIDKFHFETLNDYWDSERKLVNENYQSIPFPFTQITSPKFSIDAAWGLPQLYGYLNTWSAVQKFIAANQHNPVDDLIKDIESQWAGDEIKPISFPITLKMGYVHK